MNPANRVPDVIISGDNLDLTEALKTTIREKVQKLINHESHIVRVRIEIGFTPRLTHQREFWALGMVQLRGPDLVAKVEGDDLYNALDSLESKLSRMLRRRSRLRKVKRKNIHEVEIPALIPKAIPA